MTATKTTSRNPLPETLKPEQLYQRCDEASLPFSTTDELEPLDNHFGQDRAVEALRFGMAMAHEGYNVFVLGSTGVGKRQLLDDLLEEDVTPLATLCDWCYVNNFEAPHKPSLLALPAGTGRRLKTDMDRFVEDLMVSIPAAFHSEDYQSRVQEMGEQYSRREQEAFEALGEKAREQNVALIQTPNGYSLAPMRDDKILSPQDFDSLPEEEKSQFLEVIEQLKDELKAIVRQLPLWLKEGREKMRSLNQEFSRLAIDQLFAELVTKYEALPEVVTYLHAVKDDVIDNVDEFREQGGEDKPQLPRGRARAEQFPRYSINVLVDNSGQENAPVICEDNPSFVNLVGRVEHVAQYGTLMTDFTLIKPGALHLANGGYLILDAAKVLNNPFAWETLKRILRTREIRIQSLDQMFSFVSTTQLEPEPMPLTLKVVLTGDRYLYYLLDQYDPEFSQLFKVVADMSEDVERTPDSTLLMARLVRTLQQRHGLGTFHRSAVARVIEHCSRVVSDGEKLSLNIGSLKDLLCESDFWAGREQAGVITRGHVDQAIRAGIRRLDQYREKSSESILRNIQLVDTSGTRIGQVNGLSVYQLGNYAFGRPTRVTATARLGAGRVLDIEREVKLGGNIHSKGVMIISALMANRYARNRPLPVSATLAFEQSYGGVEGDSASVAELTALLSALSEIPVLQSLAVTGSLNQHGQVQAIGGVNEKIEGFFDICQARGLTGEQGVVIPAANSPHLMLRDDVVAAVADGQFHIHAVDTIDQALSLLMGRPAGEPDEAGNYPSVTINGEIVKRIEALIDLHRQYGRGREDDQQEGTSEH